ncbi:unnamed protein product [Hymenolepis diminuta]|uniref:CTNNB1_binding domain-containing protein n=1 Tax=Hymenolepis diminuta TaxID=6216 RepID=A0A0R3SY39_HYMDI|nr:unnamed protein product [Hymenolepis diminuta]
MQEVNRPLSISPPEFNHSSTEAYPSPLSLRRDDKMTSMDTGKNLSIETVKSDGSIENEEEEELVGAELMNLAGNNAESDQ